MPSSKRLLEATAHPAALALAEARAAWLDGRYLDCLDLVKNANARRPSERLEALLLRARALLRVARPREMLSCLEQVDRVVGSDADAADAVATLRGIALVRTEQTSAGLALLEAPLLGHDAYVRSERAYYLSSALWVERRLNEAEAALGPALEPSLDVMYARALGMLGFIETSRANYARASRAFMDSFAAARTARHRDQHVLASALHVLASFAYETIDPHLARVVERDYEHVTWSDDLSALNAYVLHGRAWWGLLSGHPSDAWRLFNQSVAASSEPATQIHSHLGLCTLHRIMGSRFAAKQHLDAAHYLIGQTSWSIENDDGRMALLEYASEGARLGDASATQALVRYRSAPKRRATLAALRDDPRTEATELAAFGLVAKMQGGTNAASDLERAARVWASVGYHLQHAQVLLDLHDLRPSRVLLDEAARLADLAPRSWLRAEVTRRQEPDDDFASALSTAERRVMRAICEGKSAKQIAADLGRSVSTVNNQTRAIYDALGVRTRAALIAKYGARARPRDASARSGEVASLRA